MGCAAWDPASGFTIFVLTLHADQDLLLIDFDTSAAGNSRHSVRSQARGARAL